MGIPVKGPSIGWPETEQAAPNIQRWATEQLLCLWRKQRSRSDNVASWGDEIEYNLVDLNPDAERATLLLDQEKVIRQWEESPASNEEPVVLQWEWAKYVVETTPAEPYTEHIEDILSVEQNMNRRRQVINHSLSPNQHTMSLSFFPRAGADGQWTTPQGQNQTNYSMCSLPRYRTIPENILKRGQGRKKTHYPVYQDIETPNTFHDILPSGEKVKNHLCLDDLEVGIGCCSLQTTFQAQNETEARWLHDQLIPLAPIFLAMTAAVPIWKGYLVDTDIRWQRFGDLTDDRRPEEMETTPPRWTWNRTYISEEKPPGLESESPIQPMNPAIKQRLLDGGMDESLATHFASILSRDPLVLTEEDIHNQNTSKTNLFELLQSCVWHAVRFKLPTTDSGPGWCVEFRTMESQLTDKANAAFAIFAYLLSRAISTMHLNFYIPINKVGESMDFAKERDAVREGKMWFRRSGWLVGAHSVGGVKSMCKDKAHKQLNGEKEEKGENFALMTADEIFNGESEPNGFPGLVAIVRYYLNQSKMPSAEQDNIAPYLELISERASGKNPTPATWMREFVRSHEHYRQDSYVSERVCYDMMKEIVRMNEDGE
ncbi:Glutamate-cysteine ligase catalytic subunit [Penicillium expansum]|uniref:Glutamate--cysteine ligase n=1 Tax=Penicillium expansum TaxID=27334 RepID=A0A0A2K544_PENEN|nr:Glutamate-cysteine ligase catalytic subunit [Penicillium expansum]KGO40797.1 Glutamate-cysteine ligase catalytic subunit [Penicillium expansum]KGO59565.1 Glutamate-cysteine ligase catalytic subunit [Penicillium expansum]KGO69511.1 Glutamate-cysteine ligase catalytic subunit [Penicillium expansum]